MKLFIIAALIAGSVTAATADEIDQNHIILGEGKIIDKTKKSDSSFYLVFFDDVLYGCVWLNKQFTAGCKPLKSMIIN